MNIFKTIFVAQIFLFSAVLMFSQSTLTNGKSPTKDTKQINAWVQSHPDIKVISQAEYDRLTPVELAEIDALEDKIIYTGDLKMVDIESFELVQANRTLTPANNGQKVAIWLRNHPRINTMPKADFEVKLPGSALPNDIIVYEGAEVTWQDIENFVQRTH